MGKNNNDFDYILITNSPGELSAWVAPVGRALREREPEARIVILLVPCFYATGREADIAGNFPFTDLVLRPSEFIKISLGISKFTPAKHGAVISLGGDPWHAVLIASKFKYPSFLYTMKGADTAKKFAHIFTTHDLLKEQLVSQGALPENISVMGDLMQDSVKPELSVTAAKEKWQIADGEQLVTFFPGSRLSHVEESLPVFMKVAEQIRSELPKTKFIICLSPFVKIEDVAKFIKKRKKYIIESSWGELDGDTIVTNGGCRIPVAREKRFDLISISDLVITIPGTNTAEIASLGRPMLTVYTWKAKIPSGGLSFLINRIPWQGILKKKIMELLYSKIKFKSLPNATAGREVAPEIGVEENAEEISSPAISLLKDREKATQISNELRGIMGHAGASYRMAEKIIEITKEFR